MNKDIDVFYNSDDSSTRTSNPTRDNSCYLIGDENLDNHAYFLYKTRPYMFGTIYLWKVMKYKYLLHGLEKNVLKSRKRR